MDSRYWCEELEIGPSVHRLGWGQISELPAVSGGLGDAALPVCLAKAKLVADESSFPSIMRLATTKTFKISAPQERGRFAKSALLPARP
jgi:hypothetical protein